MLVYLQCKSFGVLPRIVERPYGWKSSRASWVFLVYMVSKRVGETKGKIRRRWKDTERRRDTTMKVENISTTFFLSVLRLRCGGLYRS